MSLVLVLSVASLALGLTDAEYQYNVPRALNNLHGNQLAYVQQGQRSQHHIALPNDQIHPSLNHAASNGYVNTGYTQSFAPAPSSNNYVQNYAPISNQFHNGHIQNFLPVTSGNANGGYTQTSLLPDPNSNINYNQNLISNAGNLNTGYTQTSSASAAVHLNNGYSHSSLLAQPDGNNLNNGQAQILQPAINVNVNNGYSNVPAPPINPGFSHNYTQTAIPSAPSNLNNGWIPISGAVLDNDYSTSSTSSGQYTGYSQSVAPVRTTSFSNNYAQASVAIENGVSQAVASSSSSSSNQGYSQTSASSAVSNLNNGDSYRLVPYSSTSSSSNGYTQPSIPLVGVNLNTGHSQSAQLSSTGSSSNGYSQTSAAFNQNVDYSQTSQLLSSGAIRPGSGFSSTAGSTVNTQYSQLPTANFNTGYSQTVVPPGSVSINSGYSQISTPQIGTNVNAGFSQSLSFASTGSSLNNVYSQASTTSFNGNSNPVSSFNPIISSGSIETSTGNTGFTQSGSNSNFISNRPLITPTVFKHVYFHVPPPEVEEQKVIPPPPPPKKNYKILFIKVPSQESKVNMARLQQMVEMRNAAAAKEEKTLIYVLVKNPETPQPVVIPKHTPSEHEVFFVKYNGNPLDIAADVNEELEKTGTVKSIVPLEPGLVNGKK